MLSAAPSLKEYAEKLETELDSVGANARLADASVLDAIRSVCFDLLAREQLEEWKVDPSVPIGRLLGSIIQPDQAYWDRKEAEERTEGWHRIQKILSMMNGVRSAPIDGLRRNLEKYFEERSDPRKARSHLHFHFEV